MLHFRVPTPEELAKADKSSMVRKQSKECTAQQYKPIPVTNNVFGGSSNNYSYDNSPSFPPLPQYPQYPDDDANNDDDDTVARLFAAGYL